MENQRVNNNIEKVISARIPVGMRMTPKKDFFKLIGIRQRRWGQIFRNEKTATLEEIGKVSRYFDIPINLLIDDSMGAASDQQN